MDRSRLAWTAGLLGLTAPLMVLALYLIFHYAPDEKVMGPVQKIFYFHVPVAMVAFLSTFVMLGASIGFLWTRARVWDDLARSATEQALLFCALVLITGPIWAKPAWGVWWTWEAKLTTTLLLALLLSASLLVRRYAMDPEQGARIASVLGIVAALDVPIIHKAVDWWRGQHPLVFGPGRASPLDPRMKTTFFVCLGVFVLLYGLFLAVRMRVLSHEHRVQALAEGWAARTGGSF